MLPYANPAASIIFILFTNLKLNDADLIIPTTFSSENSFLTEIGFTKWNSSKRPFTKFKIKKRTSRKSLGDRCSTFQDCPHTALCVSGICACPYDYYSYAPQSESDMAVCRKKLKFSFLCSLSEDCMAYDDNSACLDGLCKCINGTHYIGSRSLLSYNKKCYKILEREGDICEVDEQCSRLADNNHKCRCVGRCDCTSISRYSGCSVCHDNIKRTFFGGAAFLFLLLSSRVFNKMRSRSDSRQMPSSSISGSRERCYRLNTSRTVPLPSVSYSRSNLRGNQRVAASLPDVFLIETHNLLGFSTSNTTEFHPQSRSSNWHCPAENLDAPPSYEDILDENQGIWNEPPPAYNEVAPKNI